jgi:dienelactone hydrolase
MHKSFIIVSALLFIMLGTLSAQDQTITPASITIDRDGIELKGKFYFSEGAGYMPTVILLPGFPGNETDVLGLGNKLCQSGFNTLTFNYSGTFQSQGTSSWDQAQKDIEAAYKFLLLPQNIQKYKIDTSAIFLGGWCFGGSMALPYASVHPEITAVFSIAGNDQGEWMREYVRNPEMKKTVDKMFDDLSVPKGHVRFEKNGLPSDIAQKGLENMNPLYDVRKCAPALAPKHILLIGAWNDNLTTMEQIVLPLYRSLQKEKAQHVQIVALQDDHWFRNSRDELAQIVSDWLKKELNR